MLNDIPIEIKKLVKSIFKDGYFDMPLYDRYLKTNFYREIRRKIRERDKKKCVYCRKKGYIVHHKKYTYLSLLGLDFSLLECLCKVCHDHIHFVRDFDTFLQKDEIKAEYKKCERLLPIQLFERERTEDNVIYSCYCHACEKIIPGK